jgi:hypothetical protein
MASFSDYVEYPKRMVMIHGPQEYEKRGIFNSAGTSLAMWRKLIKEADLTVLSAKIFEDHRNKETKMLRFHNLARIFIPKVALDWPGSRSGPAPH